MPFEKINQKETQAEVIKTPEIEIKEEKGPILLSVLLKGHNPEWEAEKSDSKVAEEVDRYFNSNPLNEESREFLEKINALEEEGVDEETLYSMALLYNSPERKEGLLNFMQNNKEGLPKSEKIVETLIQTLTELDKSLPEDIKKTVEKRTSEEIELLKENINETKKQIEYLIDFFRPHPETTTVNRVTITPTDLLYKKDSESYLQFGDEMIIRSHTENQSSIEHEFLHGVINPIVKKLSKGLTEEQKKKVSDMGSHTLRLEQSYGDDFFSVLLSEEFIRTYSELIQRVETPTTSQDFQENINRLDETEFNKLLTEKGSFKKNCKRLDISTLQDLKSKSQQFYNNFIENKLREVVFIFYQKYIHEREQNEEISFEEFVLNNFEKEI